MDDLKVYNILMEHKALKQAEREQAEQGRKKAAQKSELWKAAILALLVAIGITVAVLASSVPEKEMVETWDDGWDDPVTVIEVETVACDTANGDTGEMEPENELIEAALFESGYFRSDIPLDGDTQAELRAACEEFNIEYTLALAVIHQETRFRNITGDGGRSTGYMQIQKRWHAARMAELGVTDLTVPYQNFRVGCSYLRELLDLYGTETRALTAYNTGRPGTSSYARSVLAYKASLES